MRADVVESLCRKHVLAYTMSYYMGKEEVRTEQKCLAFSQLAAAHLLKEEHSRKFPSHLPPDLPSSISTVNNNRVLLPFFLLPPILYYSFTDINKQFYEFMGYVWPHSSPKKLEKNPWEDQAWVKNQKFKSIYNILHIILKHLSL